MVALWLKFFIYAGFIIVAGTILARSAEKIARVTGLGTIWAGALLLPLGTSLPELVTSWRAAVIGAPDLAVGNILGSCLFNILLIALIDLLHGKGALLCRVSQRHIFTAAMVILLTCYVALVMLVPISFSIGWIGLDTLFIPILYFGGVRLLTKFEKRHRGTEAAENIDEGKEPSLPSLLSSVLFFAAAALVIVAAGTGLADTGEVIARTTGLSATLFGSFFIAISTSLPELVTVFSAVRLGVPDMAVGNVFGANFFNLFIIFFIDMFYTQGALLQAISSTHVVTAIMSVVLTSLAVIGLIYRSRRCFARLGYDSIAIAAGYVVAMVLLYAAGS